MQVYFEFLHLLKFLQIYQFLICHNEDRSNVLQVLYDIHSPRVPSIEEIVNAINIMLTKINKDKLWINPDCGLKTRAIPETNASLKNMVKATKQIRSKS